MLSENRNYDYCGLITLNKSHLLSVSSRPKDDTVNWLFLKIGQRQLSFVYKIINPTEADYGKPFEIEMAFAWSELALGILQLGNIYPVLRGQEEIGSVKLTDRKTALKEINKEIFYEYIEHLIGIPISDNTLFFQDTGLDGFDAEILMMNIGDNYDLEMDLYESAKFHFAYDEVTNIPKFIYWKLFDNSKLKKMNFSALHLYKVVKAGKWFDPNP